MRFLYFEWDEKNTIHILRHHVKPDETEEACFNDPFILKGPEGKYAVYGRTDAGRYLLVIVAPKNDRVRVITARDMDQTEKRRFSKNKR